MELLVKRTAYTTKSTISEFYIDGYPVENILEDVVRWPTAPKVYGETAIPAGRYCVVVTLSPHFGRKLPRLLNVKGGAITFGGKNIDDCGVLIHTGNRAEDSEGCLIMGHYDPKTPNWVSESRTIFDAFFRKLTYALSTGQEVYLTIQDTRDSVLPKPGAPAPAAPAPKKK